MFPGYACCRFADRRYLPILQNPKVTSFVTFGSEPALIPDEPTAYTCVMAESGLRPEPRLNPACPTLKGSN